MYRCSPFYSQYFAQAPTISYSGQGTFTTGIAISTLKPINTGGAIPVNTYASTTTQAGGGASGFADGTGTAAAFDNLSGITADRQGYLFVADLVNKRIRKITPDRVVTTFAGSGKQDGVDGTGLSACFSTLKDIVGMHRQLICY